MTDGLVPSATVRFEGLGLGAMQISGHQNSKVFKNVLPDDFEARSEALKIGAHYDLPRQHPKSEYHSEHH